MYTINQPRRRAAKPDPQNKNEESLTTKDTKDTKEEEEGGEKGMKKRPNDQVFLREATIGNKTFVPFVSFVVIFLQDNHPLKCGSSLAQSGRGMVV
jgi:hypothetical protein